MNPHREKARSICIPCFVGEHCNGTSNGNNCECECECEEKA